MFSTQMISFQYFLSIIGWIHGWTTTVDYSSHLWRSSGIPTPGWIQRKCILPSHLHKNVLVTFSSLQQNTWVRLLKKEGDPFWVMVLAIHSLRLNISHWFNIWWWHSLKNIFLKLYLKGRQVARWALLTGSFSNARTVPNLGLPHKYQGPK